MGSNRTIKDVPRELLENCASYMEGSASGTVRIWHDRLRALLDAPAVEPSGNRDRFEKLVIEKAERFHPDLSRHGIHPDADYKCSNIQWAWELFRSASQPQGEPVGYVIPGEMPAQSGYTQTVNPVPEGKYTFPLYAERPAPVAPHVCGLDKGYDYCVRCKP